MVQITIGQLSEELNISAPTVRNWELRGWLNPARRKPSGWRVYSPTDVQQIKRFIHKRKRG